MAVTNPDDGQLQRQTAMVLPVESCAAVAVPLREAPTTLFSACGSPGS
jgi:hypothetical protein